MRDNPELLRELSEVPSQRKHEIGDATALLRQARDTSFGAPLNSFDEQVSRAFDERTQNSSAATESLSAEGPLMRASMLARPTDDHKVDIPA